MRCELIGYMEEWGKKSIHCESKRWRLRGPVDPGENTERDKLDGNEDVSNMKWKWKKIFKGLESNGRSTV